MWPVKRLILLLSCGLILGSLAIEVGLRSVFDDAEVGQSYWGSGAFVPSESLGYRHAPGFNGRAFRRGAFDSEVQISTEGLRQRNLSTQLSFKHRVLILGDSYAFGLGVPEESSFVSLIQPALNSHGIGVINGAQSGYCTEQEVIFGKDLIIKFRPAMVVLCFFPGNDIEGDYLKDYQNVEVRYGIRLKRNRMFRGEPVDFLRTHSYLWRYLDSNFAHSRSEKIHKDFNKRAIAKPFEVIQTSISILKNFQIYCNSSGIRFGVVIIPSAIEQKLFYNPLRSELSKLEIPILDLPLSQFGQEYSLGPDNHWNEKGHSKAARMIEPFVQSLVSFTKD